MIPNYTRALNVSIEVLKKYNINKAPIDLMKIVEQLPDLKVLSYSSFINLYGCTIEELIDILESDLGAISRDPKTKNFVIYYNDTKGNKGLDRFTIAHELGHYFLDHFSLITQQVLNRGGFTPRQYKIMEKEANCFARNLLAPVPLYKKIPHDPFTFDWMVMDTFNISYEAAITRAKFLRLDSYRITKEHLNYFETYEILYYTYCDNCKNPEIQEVHYCPICGKSVGKDNFDPNTYKVIWKLKRSDYMIYDGIKVDGNSKAVFCPNCGNEEPNEGNFCSICGEFITNMCTNTSPEIVYELATDHPSKNYCSQMLDGNARYCTHCGAESTFLRKGFLKPWQQVEEEHEDEDESYFFQPYAVDDIPF